MSQFPADELEELKAWGTVNPIEDVDGKELVLVGDCRLPPGCEPSRLDVVLYPHPRDGYPTRLFLASRVVSAKEPKPNWNSSARFADRQWQAYSYRDVLANQRLAAILANHLKALG